MIVLRPSLLTIETTLMNKQTPLPPGFLKHPIHFLALGLGSGCLHKMPGTAGTVVGVLVYLPMQSLPWMVYIGTTLGLFIVGIWLCGSTARDLKVHDHRAIVWDEIVGFLVTMALLPPHWLLIGLGFVLFRAFDILKPWPINYIDDFISGGLGIMLDDLLAALFALAILHAIVYLFL